jgi:dihydrofolate reductase
MKRDLEFVVAMTRERVIGRGNALPWRLPQDLKHFKALTTGHSVIMGRKTYDSIGKPLPGRMNLVLTRDARFRAAGVTTCHSLDEAVAQAEGTPFVIGGAEIYRQALPRLYRLHLTLILETFPGDAYFPEIALEREFTLENESEIFPEPFPYRFQTWLHK